MLPAVHRASLAGFVVSLASLAGVWGCNANMAFGDLVGTDPTPAPATTAAVSDASTADDPLPPGIPAGEAADGGGVTPGTAPTCVVDAGAVAPTALVDVPAGSFMMGCNAALDTQCAADENPYHQVTLDDFAIDSTEVTQAQYAVCVQAGKCDLPRCAWDPCNTPSLPINCVYRQEAMDYCAFVGEQLPTEAQWEKAARGTDGRVYPWGNQPPTCDLATTDLCDAGLTPVGSLEAGASPYGAYDMAGNVVEWTLDIYDPSYYAESPSTDPQGPPTPTDGGALEYVGRGGGWHSDPVWERASARDNYDSLYVRDSMGFRCASQTKVASPTLSP